MYILKQYGKPFTILRSLNLIILFWTSGAFAVGVVGWQKPNRGRHNDWWSWTIKQFLV